MGSPNHEEVGSIPPKSGWCALEVTQCLRSVTKYSYLGNRVKDMSQTYGFQSWLYQPPVSPQAGHTHLELSFSIRKRVIRIYALEKKKNIFFRVVFRINELIYIKHHVQCLTCRKVQNNKLFLLLWPEHLSGRKEHSFTLILQSQFREAPILPQNVKAFSLNHREVVCRKLTSMALGPSPAPWKKLSATNSFFWVALSTALGPHGLFKK